MYGRTQWYLLKAPAKWLREFLAHASLLCRARTTSFLENRARSGTLFRRGAAVLWMAELPYAIEQPDGADVGEAVLPRRRKFAREDLAREENCRIRFLSPDRRHDQSSSRWQGRRCHRRHNRNWPGDRQKIRSARRHRRRRDGLEQEQLDKVAEEIGPLCFGSGRMRRASAAGVH